jgi:hypothetical protein
MGLSLRRFVLVGNDDLYLLANIGFWRMLNEPERYRVPELAGQRVRSAEVVVELVGGSPTRLVRSAYSILAFDRAEHLDRERLMQQQSARFEAAFAPALGRSRDEEGFVDAASRFISQGGTWRASQLIMERIEAAALGRTKCPRLSVVTR